MSESPATAVTFTREELYDKVWSEPMRRLAPSFGLSDVGLAKICRKLQVPTPPVGYWRKKEFGYEVERTPLPELDEDGQKSLVELTQQPAKPERPLSEIEVLILNERNEDRRLVVPDTVDAPHPLVERTERSLRSARPDSEGRVCPKGRRCLSVTVAPGSIDRAMRIMDTLVKALESRGYPVTTADEDGRATHVEIMGEMISFYLAEILDKKVRELTASEKRERERYAWLSPRRPEYTHFPSGRLTISIDGSFGNTRSRRRWSDGQKQSLENLLNQVVAGLLQASEDTKTARHEREERERRFQEERRQRHEVEIRRREAEIRGKDFESRVAAWARANELRLFVDAVRVEAVQRNEPIDESSEVGRWLLWAERCVSGLDPLDAGKPLPVYSVPDETKEFWRQELSRGW